MTTYNDEQWLRRSIKSVLNQTFSEIEICIVDDGSTDGTEQLISEFQDPRLNYVKIKHVGRSRALNYGLKKCKYDWIALIDSDDIWHPQKLEKQVDLIEYENDLIFTHSIFVKNDQIRFVIKCPKSKTDLMEILLIHGHMTTSSILYNKKQIVKYGMYDENLSNSEDYDLLIRSIEKSNYKFVDEYLVYCNLRNDSFSRINYTITKKNIRQIQKKYFERDNQIFAKFYKTNTNKLLAWREFFYGDKKVARGIWLKKHFILLQDYKVLFALIVTFLPKNIFEKLHIHKVSLKLKYSFLMKFSRKYDFLYDYKIPYLNNE